MKMVSESHNSQKMTRQEPQFGHPSKPIKAISLQSQRSDISDNVKRLCDAFSQSIVIGKQRYTDIRDVS